VTALERRGIGFKSLQECMDTTTPGGKPRRLSRKGMELAVTMLQDPNNRIDDICAMIRHFARHALPVRQGRAGSDHVNPPGT